MLGQSRRAVLPRTLSHSCVGGWMKKTSSRAQATWQPKSPLHFNSPQSRRQPSPCHSIHHTALRCFAAGLPSSQTSKAELSGSALEQCAGSGSSEHPRQAQCRCQPQRGSLNIADEIGRLALKSPAAECANKMREGLKKGLRCRVNPANGSVHAGRNSHRGNEPGLIVGDRRLNLGILRCPCGAPIKRRKHVAETNPIFALLEVVNGVHLGG
jgi:hypothetical protein